ILNCYSAPSQITSFFGIQDCWNISDPNVQYACTSANQANPNFKKESQWSELCTSWANQNGGGGSSGGSGSTGATGSGTTSATGPAGVAIAIQPGYIQTTTGNWGSSISSQTGINGLSLRLTFSNYASGNYVIEVWCPSIGLPNTSSKADWK